MAWEFGSATGFGIVRMLCFRIQNANAVCACLFVSCGLEESHRISGEVIAYTQEGEDLERRTDVATSLLTL
jgi:hypothetical protein